MNEEAARSVSRIIVNTELATTGYAFESRREIASFAESIPGPTTRAFSRIASDYGCYICIGLPDRDAKVPALRENASSKFIWEARLGEQMHLAIANQWGNFGRLHAQGESLLCNYSRYP